MGMTPAQQASYDQAHAGALSDLEEFIADARRLIDQHGAQAASHFMLGELMESAEANEPHGFAMIAGTAALALVELARREMHSRDSPA